MGKRLRPLAVIFSAALMAMSCPDRDATGPSSKARPKTVQDSIFGVGNVLWFTPDSVGAWTMEPAVDAERVYFERDQTFNEGTGITGPAQFVALDRATGSQLWGSPFISGVNVAVAGSAVAAPWGSLPIFDRASGTETSHFTYDATSLSTNVVSDGTRFFVGSHDGHVLAIDPATGTTMWDVNLSGGETGAAGVAVTDNLVLATLTYYSFATFKDSGIVAALDRSTGAIRWRVAVPSAPEGSFIAEPPVVVGGTVIVVTGWHDVHAFNLANGVLSWSKDASYTSEDVSNDGLATCGGNVIVPTGDMGLVALSPSNGSVVWRRTNLNEGSLFSIQCSYGTIIAHASRLRVLDAATGANRARYPIIVPDHGRQFWITSATRDETSLYVGTTYGFARIKAP